MIQIRIIDPSELGQRIKGLNLARVDRFGAVIVYLLTVLCGVLLAVMWQVDAALQQVRTSEIPGISFLRFSFSASHDDAGRVREFWATFKGPEDPGGLGFTRLIRPPSDLALTVVFVDLIFIAAYLALFSVLLFVAHRALHNHNATGGNPPAASTSAQGLRTARQRMLSIAPRLLGILVVADLTEEALLLMSYVTGPSSKALFFVGQLATGFKFVFASLLVAILLVVGVNAFMSSHQAKDAVKDAVIAARGVLIVVAGCWLLFSFSIGAEQVDDVIRAWQWKWEGIWAALAVGVLVTVVLGSITQLTNQSVDATDPDRGGSPRRMLLVVALGLGVAGILMVLVGWGYGLLIPAALVVLLLGASIPFNRYLAEPKHPGEMEPSGGQDKTPWAQPVVAFDLGGSVGQDTRRARDVDVVGSRGDFPWSGRGPAVQGDRVTVGA